MSLVGEIVSAYRAPKQLMKVQLAKSGEERILLLALLFCFLTFIARLPELAFITGSLQSTVPFSARVVAMFVSSVLMAPLMMYLVAAISHFVLRLFGARGTWREARLALMWAALVSVPLVLISGALKVLAPGLLFSVATLATGVVFLWQWVMCLQVVEFSPHEKA